MKNIGFVFGALFNCRMNWVDVNTTLDLGEICLWNIFIVIAVFDQVIDLDNAQLWLLDVDFILFRLQPCYYKMDWNKNENAQAQPCGD